VHHILRRIANHTQAKGKPPKPSEIDQLFEDEFYLPYADRPAYEAMRAKGRKLVDQYLTDYADDLERIWEVERAFELHLPEANIAGRADVILDREDGQVDALALVDYKTKPDPHQEPIPRLQLAIYTGAARGEGLDVRAAYLHDLSAPKPLARTSVPSGEAEVEKAKAYASRLAAGIRSRRHEPTVGPHCKSCDVRAVCKHGPVS
jgi:DNA helicase-2/ATP-dependent DNA helicase PcrA